MGKCSDGTARVETQHSFGNQIAAALTLGLYTPMEITVTCAEHRTREALLAPAGSCGASTIRREGDDLVASVSLLYHGKCETQRCRSTGGAIKSSDVDVLSACLNEARAGMTEP
jgi:hypothetical protein